MGFPVNKLRKQIFLEERKLDVTFFTIVKNMSGVNEIDWLSSGIVRMVPKVGHETGSLRE